ncbi:hypothetical protein [Paraferrimonas sedimenticola]|uniref:Uncharacterized protein n=1 Tax=Paraferrimonas sedimenticola TaxID=375674 RepID=A0AA37W1C3_9GAMM|nr:hypothetical protein [Paraferrimonas sedimenticola]GLP96057.1 hypothetical protein GCM10007895_13630 [Paraferrimonas sedimenticola]
MSNQTVNPTDAEMQEFMATEQTKWDQLNGYMHPQFEGQRAYVEHGFARYRTAFVGDTNAVYMPDPDQGEMEAMTGDSCSDEVKNMWRENKGKLLKDVDPELHAEMTEESDGLAKALRDCGVNVIRNDRNEYPEAIVDFNANWKGPKFVSIYGGPTYGRIIQNKFVQIWECGPVRQWELAFRQGTEQLFNANPDLEYRSMQFPEPDVNLRGPGTPGLDNAAVKIFPDSHLLFGYGVADEKHIEATYNPETRHDYTSAGNPLGGKFLMERVLNNDGFTSEEIFFDSKLTYHFDCFLMMIKEGVVGMPDTINHGLMHEHLPECLKDYEIVPLPLEDIARGVSNAPTIGDGRILIDNRCTETMKRLQARGIEPVPVKYEKCWDTFNSGMDCSDAEIWRQDIID